MRMRIGKEYRRLKEGEHLLLSDEFWSEGEWRFVSTMQRKGVFQIGPDHKPHRRKKGITLEGDGYYLLKEGDFTQKGDEYLANGVWSPIEHQHVRVFNNAPVRRAKEQQSVAQVWTYKDLPEGTWFKAAGEPRLLCKERWGHSVHAVHYLGADAIGHRVAVDVHPDTRVEKVTPPASVVARKEEEAKEYPTMWFVVAATCWTRDDKYCFRIAKTKDEANVLVRHLSLEGKKEFHVIEGKHYSVSEEKVTTVRHFLK